MIENILKKLNQNASKVGVLVAGVWSLLEIKSRLKQITGGKNH